MTNTTTPRNLDLSTLSDSLKQSLSIAHQATLDNDGDFGFADEMVEGKTKKSRLYRASIHLRNLEAAGLVSVDWNTKVNGKPINDHQFSLTDLGETMMEPAPAQSPKTQIVLSNGSGAVRIELCSGATGASTEWAEEIIAAAQDVLTFSTKLDRLVIQQVGEIGTQGRYHVVGHWTTQEAARRNGATATGLSNGLHRDEVLANLMGLAAAARCSI